MPTPTTPPAATLGLSLLVLTIAAGCENKPPEPTAAPPPTAMDAEDAARPGPAPPAGKPRAERGATATDLGWTKPDAWQQVDHPSKMRKATFEIPKVEGDPENAEMSVTQVGGSILANIKRWEGQFQGKPEAATEKKKVNGLEVTVVTIEGTYAGGGPMMGGGGEPKEDWALLAAIVATEPAHFFKMTGPRKTVQAARGDFDSLVASFAEK